MGLPPSVDVVPFSLCIASTLTIGVPTYRHFFADFTWNAFAQLLLSLAVSTVVDFIFTV